MKKENTKFRHSKQQNLICKLGCDFRMQRIKLLKTEFQQEGKTDYSQICLRHLTNNTKCKKAMRNVFKDSWEYDYGCRQTCIQVRRPNEHTLRNAKTENDYQQFLLERMTWGVVSVNRRSKSKRKSWNLRNSSKNYTLKRMNLPNVNHPSVHLTEKNEEGGGRRMRGEWGSGLQHHSWDQTSLDHSCHSASIYLKIWCNAMNKKNK